MIFAELRKEGGGDEGYFTLRYLVYNGDIIGSYGVHYSPSGPYGASRDYHSLATPEEAAAFKVWDALNDSDKSDFDSPDYLPYGSCYNECCYHDDKLSICDGSSMVEIITDDDKAAYMIAAMMAQVNE